jgi:hypothetical protein
MIQIGALFLVSNLLDPGTKSFGGCAALGYGPAEETLQLPVWLGKDYQLQRQAGPLAELLERVEPVLG